MPAWVVISDSLYLFIERFVKKSSIVVETYEFLRVVGSCKLQFLIFEIPTDKGLLTLSNFSSSKIFNPGK